MVIVGCVGLLVMLFPGAWGGAVMSAMVVSYFFAQYIVKNAHNVDMHAVARHLYQDTALAGMSITACLLILSPIAALTFALMTIVFLAALSRGKVVTVIFLKLRYALLVEFATVVSLIVILLRATDFDAANKGVITAAIVAGGILAAYGYKRIFALLSH